MYKVVLFWDVERQKAIDDIRDSRKDVSGIVLLGNVEADTNVIPRSELEEIFLISNSNNIPVHLVIAGHKDDQNIIDKRNLTVKPNHLQIYYWPTYYLTQTLVRMLVYKNDSYNQNLGYDIKNLYTGLNNLNFQHTLICLNKRPKVHRLVVLDYLEKYDLIKNNAITFRELYLGNLKLEYWKQQRIFLDQEIEIEPFNQEVVPKQYQHSFMQIVTESHDDIFFLTEKTSLPLFFNKPFLVTSCKHYHKKLQDLGFLLYDELFDYSFDGLENVRERTEGLVQNAYKYKNKSSEELAQLYLSIKDKLVYNKKLAIKYATDIDNFPNIWNNLATEEYKDIRVTNPLDLNKSIKNFTM